MPILAKKINPYLGGAACALSLALSAAGQEPVPQNPPSASSSPSPASQLSSTPGGAASGGAAAPAGADSSGSGGNANAALDYLFNRKPQDGSIAKQASDAQARMDDKAKAAEALGLTRMEDPQLRARFDRYLGTAEVSPEQIQAYSAQVNKVLALLKDDQVFEAWKELRQLAKFDKIDAGVSLELANRIEAIWGTDRATADYNGQNRRLEQEVRTATRNADLRSESLRKEEWHNRQRESENRGRRRQQQNNGGVPQAPAPGDNSSDGSSNLAGLEGKLQLTEEYLRSLEAKAKIKLNELKLEKLLDGAKADFASYINTLFGSHRHEHVILAANFYRKIFNEGEYPVAIANQVNASLEMSRDVKNAVEVFNYKLSRNELAGATDRLQEAFAASEFDPAVLAVPRRDKERVADFTSRLGRMQSLIEAHDFGTLATLLDEMKGIAADFDPTKPLAIVNAVKLESKLRLGKAKLAAQQGDLKLAMEEFQAAAEAWPGNPDLQNSAGTFFNSQDVKSRSIAEFDRLLDEKNFRAIFEKQLAFAPAIHGDAKREAALKDALVKIKNAEIAYEKANMMRNAGDVYGAWETIEQASAELPADNKLNMLRADLSGKGAEFVAAINKARDAEIRKEYGFSLSCYAVAQRYYPASTIANAAIRRLAQQILNNAHAL